MGDSRKDVDEEGQLEDLKKRYTQVMHQVQTGIAFHPDFKGMTDPKHLRVGINSMLVSVGALTQLLIDKGVITELEYWTALVSACEEEAQMYADQISAHVGKPVTLG